MRNWLAFRMLIVTRPRRTRTEMRLHITLAASVLILGSVSPAGATLLALNPGECYGTSSNCTGLTIIPTPATIPVQNNVLNLGGPNLVADTGIRLATGIG